MPVSSARSVSHQNVLIGIGNEIHEGAGTAADGKRFYLQSANRSRSAAKRKFPGSGQLPTRDDPLEA